MKKIILFLATVVYLSACTKDMELNHLTKHNNDTMIYSYCVCSIAFTPINSVPFDSFIVAGINITDSGVIHYQTTFLTSDSVKAYYKCDSIANSATGGYIHTYSIEISRWYY